WVVVLLVFLRLSAVARRGDAARLWGVAPHGVIAWLFLRGVRRHGRLLAAGSDVVPLHHQYSQLLRLRAHVSTGSVAPRRRDRFEGATVSISGVLSGH